MRRTLWVARHAPVAASGVCYGQCDVPTALADEEAAAVLLSGIARESIGPVAEVWASPTRRTEPVAAIVAAQLGARLRVDARIAELAMGDWEGRRFDAIEREDGERYRRWMAEWRTEGPPNGETIAQLVARVRGWLAERDAESVDGACVAVTHAGVIRALRALATGGGYEEEMARSVGHLVIEPHPL
jgi:alpha-ribazole phosphatase